MLKKFSQLGLLSVALFGTIGLPSFAQNTISQTANMEATVSGTNNQVNQTINQTIINHPGQGSINRKRKKNRVNNGPSNHHGQLQNRGNRRHNRNDN